MRKRATTTAAVVFLLAAAPITACGASSAPTASISSQPHIAGGAMSKTAAASDYSNLLIKPDAIGAPDETYTARPPTLNPHGIPGASTAIVNQADTRAVGSTIFVLPTADVATASLNAARQALGTVIKGAAARPAPVGANGAMATGRSPDGSKAVTVVMFTEGRTLAILKFDAAPGDAMPAPLAAQVAQRQDARIKTTPH